MPLLRFVIFCTPLDWVGEMKISFARLPPREVCSTLDHSSTFLSLMMVLLSLGNVFDRVRFL
jgi:hypothetical protein